MEAFTNHQVFANTMKAIRQNKMFTSEFFAPLKMLNLTVLRPFYGLLAKIINPITNGKATQRANTYTYRTPHYLMATAQGYLPGGFSDQQHIWSCMLNHDICVFATHPSGELSETGALSKSPGYWVGNSRNPHAAQHLNRILAIYHLPMKKASFEQGFHEFTHAYFPIDAFDEVISGKGFYCGRSGDSYVALFGASDLTLAGRDELKQYGKKQYWICECSSVDIESFEDFVARAGRDIEFDGDRLRYDNLELTYGGDFYVDGTKENTQYKRYDSIYCTGDRLADEFVYKFDGAEVTVK